MLFWIKVEFTSVTVPLVTFKSPIWVHCMFVHIVLLVTTCGPLGKHEPTEVKEEARGTGKRNMSCEKTSRTTSTLDKDFFRFNAPLKYHFPLEQI